MSPLNLVPLPYRILAVAALLAAAFATGWIKGETSGEAQVQLAWDHEKTEQLQQAQLTNNQQRQDSGKVESTSAKEIAGVVTPPAVVADQLSGGCVRHRAIPTSATGVPVPAIDAGQPADAADGADTDPRLFDALAPEISAAVRNGIKGRGVQALVRANAPQPPQP